MTVAVAQKGSDYNQLAGLWPDFVGKRWEGAHGEFLMKMLVRHNCQRVFNAAGGVGDDTLNLLKRGFSVKTNEIDTTFIKVLGELAQKKGANIELSTWDWREMERKGPAGEFDAVLLMGNSLTHLFSKEERLRSLRGFLHVLKPGGILVIDERNYQRMLDNRDEIVGMVLPRSKTYPSDTVRARLDELTDGHLVMRYMHNDGRTGTLRAYPFKHNELAGELREAGFVIVDKYSDYHRFYGEKAQFYQYVAKKPFGRMD